MLGEGIGPLVSRVQAARSPIELAELVVVLPEGLEPPPPGSVIRNDLLFTTGAWYPQHEPNVPLQVVVLVLWPLSYAGLAVTTGLEPAASGLTGQRSDQLSYATIDLAARMSLRFVRNVIPSGYANWHEEIRTPMTFLTGRRPAVERRAIESMPGMFPLRHRGDPTGSRTLFRGLKGRDLTHRRWGHWFRDACEI